MKKNKLLPCPFCGSSAYIWYVRTGFKVSCDSDCVTMPPRHDVWATSEEEIVKKWNTRTSYDYSKIRDLSENIEFNDGMDD